MEICRECGSKIKVIKNKPYKYDECGLDVVLYGLNQFVCTKCKEHFVEIPRINELHRVIGGILCKEKKGLLTANEIKYLRKDLHLKSKEFAQILGVTPSTVSRWENAKKQIGETQDRLLRSIYMLYASEKEEQVVCHGVVKMFSDLPTERKRSNKQSINLNPPDWLSGIAKEFCRA